MFEKESTVRDRLNRQSLLAYRRRAEPELNLRPRRKVNRQLQYGVAL